MSTTRALGYGVIIIKRTVSSDGTFSIQTSPRLSKRVGNMMDGKKMDGFTSRTTNDRTKQKKTLRSSRRSMGRHSIDVT